MFASNSLSFISIRPLPASSNKDLNNYSLLLFRRIFELTNTILLLFGAKSSQLLRSKLMLSRTVRVFFSQAHKNINPTEITAKMTDLRSHIRAQEDQLVQLRQQIKEKETLTAAKNQAIYEKRVRLTEDVKKSEQVWADAKKKSEANKSAAIHSFADSLIDLGIHFNKTKQLEKEEHSVDLREGFDNTARLFFNTLEKFKIKQIDTKVGATFRRAEVEIVREEKAGVPERKHTIGQILEPGWEVDGKILRKPKVVIYN